MASTKYHVRCISLPSRSHTGVARVEEELNKLKTWEISSASSNDSHSLCIGLTMLEGLYGHVDSLLNMGSTQQVLSQSQVHEKHIDILLEASVKLLDVCGITRDVLLQTNEHVRQLQSALRRRRSKGDSSFEASVSSYICFRKKTKKDVKKFVSTLKQVDKRFHIHDQEDMDSDHFYAVIGVLRQVCVTSVLVFQSLLSLLAVCDQSKSNKSSTKTRWSLVAKFIHKGVVACEDQKQVQQCVNRFERVDTAVIASNIALNIGDAQRRLEALETSVDGLDKSLESVFRGLIKIRASLLNIISH